MPPAQHAATALTSTQAAPRLVESPPCLTPAATMLPPCSQWRYSQGRWFPSRPGPRGCSNSLKSVPDSRARQSFAQTASLPACCLRYSFAGVLSVGIRRCNEHVWRTLSTACGPKLTLWARRAGTAIAWRPTRNTLALVSATTAMLAWRCRLRDAVLLNVAARPCLAVRTEVGATVTA